MLLSAFSEGFSEIGEVTEGLFRDIAGLKDKRDTDQIDFNFKSTARLVRVAEL